MNKYQAREVAKHVYVYPDRERRDPRNVVCPSCYAPIGERCIGMYEDIALDYC